MRASSSSRGNCANCLVNIAELEQFFTNAELVVARQSPSRYYRYMRKSPPEGIGMRWMVAIVLIALSGCRALYLDVDTRVAERAAQPVDLMPPVERLPEPTKLPPIKSSSRPSLGVPTDESGVELIRVLGYDEQPDKEKKPPMLQRLEFKSSILKIKIDDLVMPTDPTKWKEREEAIRKQFPELRPAPALPEPPPGPEGRALTLADLQQIALRNNPIIRQAHQDIQAARGNALQAGLYPNPTIGYEASTTGQGNFQGTGARTPGQQGGFVEQQIITAGKLTLARNAALREVDIAEQRLKAIETDVLTQVRTQYFNVLSARENYRVVKGLTDLTDELFNVLLAQLLIGDVAAYEPMQIRVLAVQSRGQLVQSQNRYLAAWRHLASSLGAPTMPLTALEGEIDMPVPRLEQARVLAFVLANHSDVISATLGIEKARLLTRLAEVQPYPDITAHVAIQRDFTTPPFGQVSNIMVGVPFPLWNRNQGGILNARATWQRAILEQARVNNDLTARVAEVFQRYDNNRILLEMYKKDMLPNQVQAFRAAVARHVALGNKEFSYNDMVTVQQALVNLIGTYLTALNDQWVAVVDIANLLQTRDLFQLQPLEEGGPIHDSYPLYRPKHLHAH
jgi:outer membrane protein, heavy metal efflux system